jgi:replication factor C subunit 3/5
MDKHNMPWIEKYRPQTLDAIIDHKVKIDTLKSLIKSGNMTHLLFYGSPGSGKTSMIHACAREMYGDNYKKYILELNASNDRGIDTVRIQIPTFLKISSDKMKIVILDEADAMTNDAQCALRRIIEIYSKTSIFCIICNTISKINPGIKSRCTELKFTYLSPDQIKIKLAEIISIEKINIAPEAIDRLLEIHKDFRQILNILQCMHSVYRSTIITPDLINKYCGVPTSNDMTKIIEILNMKNLIEASKEIDNIYMKNEWDLKDIIKYIVTYTIYSAKMTDLRKMKIIQKLSDIDLKIVNQNDCRIQFQALLAVWRT